MIWFDLFSETNLFDLSKKWFVQFVWFQGFGFPWLEFGLICFIFKLKVSNLFICLSKSDFESMICLSTNAKDLILPNNVIFFELNNKEKIQNNMHIKITPNTALYWTNSVSHVLFKGWEVLICSIWIWDDSNSLDDLLDLFDLLFSEASLIWFV